MRFEDELEQGHECCYAHHRPVNGSEQGPLDQVILTTLHATDEKDIEIEEIASEKTYRAQVEDRRWEQCMIHLIKDQAQREVNR